MLYNNIIPTGEIHTGGNEMFKFFNACGAGFAQICDMLKAFCSFGC